MGLPLTVSVWMKLQSALLFSKKTLSSNAESTAEGVPVSAFLNKHKKGSKHFREAITKAKDLGKDVKKITDC